LCLELSHTYASGLLNAGVPLSFVAEQLGHADLRMVTRHNGHIAREAMHNAIRKAAPTFGIAGATRGEK
jgi:integrase